MQETRNNCFGLLLLFGTRAYLFSPDESSCCIFSTRNNCCEFLAYYGFIVQGIIQSFLKMPVCGASLSYFFFMPTRIFQMNFFRYHNIFFSFVRSDLKLACLFLSFLAKINKYYTEQILGREDKFITLMHAVIFNVQSS